MLHNWKSAKEKDWKWRGKLDFKMKREEHKAKEASNCKVEIEMQCEQHNQQIQMNMKIHSWP